MGNNSFDERGGVSVGGLVDSDTTDNTNATKVPKKNREANDFSEDACFVLLRSSPPPPQRALRAACRFRDSLCGELSRPEEDQKRLRERIIE